MALNRVSRGQTPAQNDAAINAAIGEAERAAGALDIERTDRFADVNKERADRVAAVDAERKDRIAGDIGLRQDLDTERSDRFNDLNKERADRFADVNRERADRVAGDQAVRTDLATSTAALGASVNSRPGDGVFGFTLGGVSGPPAGLAPLPASAVFTGDGGMEAVLAGAGILSMRRRIALEPGRIYRVRWVYQRRADVADPSGHAIVLRLAYLDATFGLLPGGPIAVKTVDDLRVADGRQETATTVGRFTAGAALHDAPAGAAYVVACLQTYGDDGRTGVQVIDALDLTDAVQVPDLSTEALGRLAQQESIQAGPRLTAIEEALQAPGTLAYQTRSDAAAATIPATVVTLVTRGAAVAGDLGAASYRRVAQAEAQAAPAAEWFRNQGGSYWLRVAVTADRVARQVSVTDYGARLNGTTDDGPAYAAARAAVGPNQTIVAPNGVHGSSYVPPAANPSQPGTMPALWQLNGARSREGYPVIGMGTDVVETMVEGGKYFARSTGYANAAPVVRIDATLTQTDGLVGAVSPALRVNQTIPSTGAPIRNFGWASSTVLESRGWGPGQHVALAALATRPADALADGHGARAPIWSLYAEVADFSQQPSNVSGSLIGFEHDMYTNGDDPGNNRILHHMVVGRQVGSGAKARVGKASVIEESDAQHGYARADRSYVGVGYGVACGFDTAAFDAASGLQISGAPAFRMAEGMGIALTANNISQVKYLSGAVRFYYGDAELLNVANGGDLNCAGSLVTGGSVRPGTDLVLNEGIASVVFAHDLKPQLKHAASALRYYYDGRELLQIRDGGGATLIGGLLVSGAIQPGTFTVATMPAGTPGAQVWASNARKAFEAAGAGTGLVAYFSGGAWRRLSDDQPITA